MYCHHIDSQQQCVIDKRMNCNVLIYWSRCFCWKWLCTYQLHVVACMNTMEGRHDFPRAVLFENCVIGIFIILVAIVNDELSLVYCHVWNVPGPLWCKILWTFCIYIARTLHLIFLVTNQMTFRDIYLN